MKDKKIKNRHVLIVGSGSSLAIYWESIKKFIDDNNVITVGINRINHILTPDYHLWTDGNAFLKFGNEISSESIFIFGNHLDKYTRREHWRGKYKILKYSVYDNKNKNINNIRYDADGNKFYGHFRTAGSLAILWSYLNRASNIKVVGMDGYTFYSFEELSFNNKAQHCYGDGFTDAIANSYSRDVSNKKNKSKFYNYCLKKDNDIYKTLKSIKNYGVNFEIITPTIYKDFYNKDILNIEDTGVI